MKKILFSLFIVLILCPVSDTAVRAITATSSSTKAASPAGNIRSRSFLETGSSVESAPDRGRALTFAERVAYQRAIEDVYWRHRIWPKENPNPKPSPDAVMSQAQLEKKVTDYLRKSQTLEDYWQRPITANQLQAEMDRMAQHTRQPEVLREVFESLGNDPFIIAECLARPVLTERLLTQSGSEQVKSTSRTDEQIVAATGNYSLPSISDAGGCTDDTWAATSTINAPAARTAHTAVWTGSEMIIWGGAGASGNTGGRYNPSTDSWTATSTTNAPQARAEHTAVWTGSEMIVWGGSYSATFLNTGGRYNPSTDSWAATSTINAPAARTAHTAVWTGNEMIVWGGYFQDGGPHVFNTGGKYNPDTNSWRATSTTNAPTARADQTAVWTGSEMIVWGGFDEVPPSGISHIGGRYNPSTDNWTATSTINAPADRYGHTAVWTGGEMIVWGGTDFLNLFKTGGRYNPSTNSWRPTSTTNVPSARGGHTAVWTGAEMIVWGGIGRSGSGGYTNTGARYSPGTDSWTVTSTINAPAARGGHTAVWTGSQMVVWGGNQYTTLFNSGGRYCAPGPPAQLGNISTRAFVQTGDNVMIGGFIVQGSEPKRVIIRAIGPELGAPPYNIASALADPTLELHDGTGALIASNDNWQHTIIGGIITSSQVHDIMASGHAPGDPRESAIIADLPGGNYTAILRGANNTIGVALVEVYDLSPESGSILGNISTRSFVQTDANVMIGGFIIEGSEPKRVILRAIGPELGAPPYNVPSALADPTLELHNGTGALIASNNNWQRTIIGGIITSSQVHDIQASGYAPGDPRESAIIANLAPGNYTGIVRGVNNTTGVALVEVYDLH